MFFRKKNQLELYREYEYHGDYSISNKIKKTSIKDIQGRLEKNLNSVVSIFVNSRFNGLYYPMFDLDHNSKLNLFQQINKDIPYVIFQSSTGHYWGILDTPKKKLSDILDKDPSWKICNDSKYVSFSKQKQYMLLRATYENYERKPFVYYINGSLSENLRLFIDAFNSYLNNQGFEFSVLHHKSEDLLEELMIRKRTEKIIKIKGSIKVSD